MNNLSLGQSMVLLHMQRLEQFGGMEKTAGPIPFQQILSKIMAGSGAAAGAARSGANFVGQGFKGLPAMAKDPRAVWDLLRQGGVKQFAQGFAPELAALGTGVLGAGALYGAGRLGMRALGLGAKQTARRTLTHGGLGAWWKAQPLMQKAMVGAGAGGLAMGTGMGLANRVVGGRQ